VPEIELEVIQFTPPDPDPETGELPELPPLVAGKLEIDWTKNPPTFRLSPFDVALIPEGGMGTVEIDLAYFYVRALAIDEDTQKKLKSGSANSFNGLRIQTVNNQNLTIQSDADAAALNLLAKLIQGNFTVNDLTIRTVNDDWCPPLQLKVIIPSLDKIIIIAISSCNTTFSGQLIGGYDELLHKCTGSLYVQDPLGALANSVKLSHFPQSFPYGRIVDSFDDLKRTS
jgi:hypothetical protein